MSKKRFWGESFYLGFALAVPLLMLPRALAGQTHPIPGRVTAVFVLGLAIETWLIPHYMAPFTAILLCDSVAVHAPSARLAPRWTSIRIVPGAGRAGDLHFVSRSSFIRATR